uniref:LRRNT domain-containing protein n=1 Tax=Anopheles maculatus TaxID=74869 RepID=A0A182S920_9DIPT
MVKLKTSCRITFYSTTLVLLVFLQQVYTFCPSICTCEGDPNVRTWCIGAGLDVVPIQLNPDVRYINLTANRITNVHFTLTFYYKLEVLDLAGNRIEALGSRNFDTQQALRTLNLSDNAIASIPKDAFRGLQRLQTLKLCGNRIETIHPAAFHDLRNLIELDLAGNAITSLEPGTLRHLYSLEVLSFQNNQLLEIPYERNLEHLGQRLQLLDLSVNLLEYIANDSFVALRELRTLRLGGNILTELDYSAFHGLNGLKALDIVDNNLTFPEKSSSSTTSSCGFSDVMRCRCSSPSQNSLSMLPNPSRYSVQLRRKSNDPSKRSCITSQPPPNRVCSQYAMKGSSVSVG